MKFIFKDEIIAKLRKLPSFVWYIVLAATFFFKNAYINLYQSAGVIAEINAMVTEQGIAGFNSTPMLVFSIIIATVISTVLFELILRVIYSIVIRRFACAINQNDFCFRLRILFIISNLILGCVGVLFFFFPHLYDIMTAIFYYLLPTLLLGWFYEDFRARYVPKFRQANLFSYVSKLYIIFFLILSAFNLIDYFVMYTGPKTVLSSVAYAVDTGLVLLTALLAYLNYLRLVKISKGPEDNDIFIIKEEKKEDGIFKDFGF